MNSKNKKKVDYRKISFIVLSAVILLVAIFLIFPLDGDLKNNKDAVATVNGEIISASEVESIKESYSQQGQQISDEEAIDQAVNQEVLSQEAEKESSVSDQEAESFLESQISQQGLTLDQYKAQMESQGISYDESLEDLKTQLTIQNYLEKSLEGQNFEVSEEEAKEFYELYGQQSQEELPPYEEIESQIILTLQQEMQQEAMNSVIQELKEESEIKYL